MITKIHRSRIEKGRPVPDDPQTYALRYCAYEGKRIEETVSPERKRRSVRESNYYWGVVIHLISEDGPTPPKQVHDAMRMMFLAVTVNGLTTTRSTTDLTTVEMEEYLTRIRQWADEFYEGRMYIPKPNEVEVR